MSRTWESIAPIIPFSALPNRESPIGPGVALGAIPEWFRRELEFAAKNLGSRETLSAEACLRVSFEADALGEMCQGPNGTPRKNHEAAYDRIRIANLALWLACPSALHVDFVVTAEPQPSPSGSAIFTDNLESIKPLRCYHEAKLKSKHLVMADSLATAIQGLKRPSPVLTAVRFLWLALTEGEWEVRYVSLWVAIEALFGPANGKKISAKLRRRIAMFLNTDRSEAQEAREKVRIAYQWRCDAVHEGRLAGRVAGEAQEQLLITEGIVMTSLRKILQDSTLIAKFSAASRDDYLSKLAHSLPADGPA